jgi:hypothetical protein
MQARVEQTRRGRSKFGVVAMAGLMAFGIIGVSAAVAGANANNRASGIPNYKNKLTSNTNGWCPVTVPANLPCDGGAGNYGTIDIVKSSFTNGGGYAPKAPAPSGQSKYARVSGGQDGGVPTVTGCTVPGGENCTGPYTKFGSTVHHAVFPAGGFTTSIKMYIDAGWAGANPGQVIDWDVSLRDHTGGFLQDNAFNLCSTANAGGGFYISDSFGAGGCSTGPSELTVSGWYTFNLSFTVVGNQIYDTYSVLNSAATQVFANVVPTGHAPSATGGPDYGWLPDEDAIGLPIADVSLTVF